MYRAQDTYVFDVLIAFSETPSLILFIASEDHLTDLPGIQVDLVMRDALMLLEQHTSSH